MFELPLILLIYIVIGTAIAFYSRRARSQEEFFIANRSLGSVVSALTYAATTYSAFMMVGLVGLTYATGVGALGFELLYLVGTLFLLSYYGPKIWKFAKDYKVVSPAEFLKFRYGIETAKLASVICLIALIPYTSAQLIGVALLLETVGIEFFYGIVIAAFLIASWAFIGGLRGVALTDAFQGVIMLTAAFTIVFYVLNTVDLSKVEKLGEMLYVPNRFWSYERFASLVVPWFFFALTNPQVFQRLFIVKDERSLKRMVIYFGTFGFLYTLLVVVLGLSLKILTVEGSFPLITDRDKVTPELLTRVPQLLSIFVSLSILMAAVTTANSIILSLSSMVSRDLVSEKGFLIGRMSVVLLTMFVAFFASQRFQYIVELSVLSSTILLCQLPLIIGFFHWKRGGKISGISTLIAGFTTSITIAILFPKFVLGSVVTVIVASAVYILASLVEKR
ncbi:MAG: sodium:solute symporter family protein [Archaeoglobaceae archaeon]|nr:sodium:solute symporter family protein [Archaeoglobaceae archaeon]MCX8152270.1 sodium:solute symporter family protein [Archaeoglobaceae archaeon]MDW8013948.1 sodium:solute symporter family protein [Archaeoglobaceae archaeon]